MDNISQTLFYPLFGRAQASDRWPELFPDPWAHKAMEIAAQEDTTAQPMDGFPELVYGLRHMILVQEARAYLETHPGAAVVNIGCGLDMLAEDLSGHECTIYNLDLPDVIELRHRWVPKADNEIDLPYSATNHEWLSKVDASRGVIAWPGACFSISRSPTFLRLSTPSARPSPAAAWCMMPNPPDATKRSERMLEKKGTPAEMPFKVKDPYSPRKWSTTVTKRNRGV